MRDTSVTQLKAWAKNYEQEPFFFEENSDLGSRIVAWSGEPAQIKQTFYALVNRFPSTVEVLLKICSGNTTKGLLWDCFRGKVEHRLLVHMLQHNEAFIFTDGTHQLCLKDPESGYYLVFDEHGIFFLYSPTLADEKIFRAQGFASCFATPIYSQPHYQNAPLDSNKMEAKLIKDLQLEFVTPGKNLK